MERHLLLPLAQEEIKKLEIGDYVYLSGILYTARDAAHKRMIEEYEINKSFPFSLEGQVIYYLGPTPARAGQVIGSAGPTTSSRMDKYTPFLLEHGLCGMIGKGKRNEEVKAAMEKFPSVYFAAVGGAGALLSKCIKKSEIVAYEDLGTEAIRRLTVEELPVIVVGDCRKNDLYETAREHFTSSF